MSHITVLVDLINENQKENMQVAEIGVYDGATTKHYIETIKNNNGHLYALDWFEGNPTATGIHGYNPNNKETAKNSFISNVEPYLDIITILDGKSEDLISHIPDNSLDICFIDADHRYSYIFKDIELCLSKVKPGGILCGHDFEWENIFDTPNPPSGWLEQDFVAGKHWGVIKAVHDHFGSDIQARNQPGGCCWVKQL